MSETETKAQGQKLCFLAVISFFLAVFALAIFIDFLMGMNVIIPVLDVLDSNTPFPVLGVAVISFVVSFFCLIIAESKIKKSNRILRGILLVRMAAYIDIAIILIGLLTFSWILFYGRE